MFNEYTFVMIALEEKHEGFFLTDFAVTYNYSNDKNENELKSICDRYNVILEEDLSLSREFKEVNDIQILLNCIREITK